MVRCPCSCCEKSCSYIQEFKLNRVNFTSLADSFETALQCQTVHINIFPHKKGTLSTKHILEQALRLIFLSKTLNPPVKSVHIVRIVKAYTSPETEDNTMVPWGFLFPAVVAVKGHLNGKYSCLLDARQTVQCESTSFSRAGERCLHVCNINSPPCSQAL